MIFPYIFLSPKKWTTRSGYLPPSKIGRLSFLQLFRDSISPHRFRRLRGCHFNLHMCRCMYIDTHTSIYLSIYLSVCLSVCLSIYLSFQLTIYLSIFLPIHLYIYNKYNTNLGFFNYHRQHGDPVEKRVPRILHLQVIHGATLMRGSSCWPVAIGRKGLFVVEHLRLRWSYDMPTNGWHVDLLLSTIEAEKNISMSSLDQ